MSDFGDDEVLSISLPFLYYIIVFSAVPMFKRIRSSVNKLLIGLQQKI